jgi:hypothetical protein
MVHISLILMLQRGGFHDLIVLYLRLCPGNEQACKRMLVHCLHLLPFIFDSPRADDPLQPHKASKCGVLGC